MKSKQVQVFKETEIGKIPKDWEVRELHEILSDKLRHGIYKSQEYVDPKGVRILKMGLLDVSDRIDYQYMERVLVSDSEIKKYRIHEGNVIFARTSMMTGGLGNCGIVMKHTDPIIFDGNLLCAEIDTKIAEPTFIFYYFKSKYGQNEIARITGGTQSRNLAGSQLVKVSVILPPKSEQIKLSKILSDLDTKIEIIKNQNQVLKQITQTIFKSVFINFDRVTKFDNSELGPIPKGWNIVSFQDFTEKFTTGLNPRKNFVLGNGANYYVTIKNMNDNDVILDDKCDKIDDGAIKKINLRSNLEKNDILLSGVGTIGKVYFIDEKPNNWNINESIFTLRSAQNVITPIILYHALLNQDFQNYIQENSVGSVQKGIRMSDINNYNFALPNIETQKEISVFLITILKKIKFNKKNIKLLTKTRNALLPKLISGEIRV